MWPHFTNLGLKRSEVEERLQYCLYRTTKGKEMMVLAPPTKEWRELVDEARDCRVVKAPAALLAEKWILALFLVILPHRATPEVIRYLGRQLGTVWFLPDPIET
jgi:hypothetical protein